jgi:hypothetical protein
MFLYLSIRAVLWFVAVLISLVPALYSVGAAVFSLPPYDCALVINAAGNFREAVFVIVVVGSLGISVIIDFWYVHNAKAHQALTGVVILLMLGNMLSLVSGVICFIVIPEREPLKDLQWLALDYKFILTALVIGLLTELVVSTANHHYGKAANL